MGCHILFAMYVISELVHSCLSDLYVVPTWTSLGADGGGVILSSSSSDILATIWSWEPLFIWLINWPHFTNLVVELEVVLSDNLLFCHSLSYALLLLSGINSTLSLHSHHLISACGCLVLFCCVLWSIKLNLLHLNTMQCKVTFKLC